MVYELNLRLSNKVNGILEVVIPNLDVYAKDDHYVKISDLGIVGKHMVSHIVNIN